MKNTLKRLVMPLIALLASQVCATAASRSTDSAVIPQPRQAEAANGPSLHPDELRYVIADGATPYPGDAAQLDALPRHKSKGKGVTLRIDNTGNQP